MLGFSAGHHSSVAPAIRSKSTNSVGENDMKFNYGSGSAIFVFIIALVGVGGWVANIVKLINTGFVIAEWGGLEVARIIGIFVAPLGSILGFF